MALQYAAIFIHNSLSSHIHMRQTHHAHVLTHIVGTLHTTQPTHTVSPPASMGVSRVKQDGNLHVQGETLTHKQRTHTTNHSPSPSAIHTSPRNLPWGGALYPPTLHTHSPQAILWCTLVPRYMRVSALGGSVRGSLSHIAS